MSFPPPSIIVPRRCADTRISSACNCLPSPRQDGYVCQHVNLPKQTAPPTNIKASEQLQETTKLPVTRDAFEQMANVVQRQMNAAREIDADSYGPMQRNLEQMVAEGRTNTISPQLTQQIQNWCHQDQRVDRFWYQLIRRIRGGLNDQIVNVILQALSQLLRENDAQLAVVQTKSQTQVATLLHACRDALKAFEDAKGRDDPLYMAETMEEIDAALYDIEQREEPHGQ